MTIVRPRFTHFLGVALLVLCLTAFSAGHCRGDSLPDPFLVAGLVDNPDGLSNEGSESQPAPEESVPTAAGGNYSIVSGDTLWDLAARFYGDAGRWEEIWKANVALIANPNLIFPGQMFVIPGVDDTNSSSGSTPTNNAGTTAPGVAPDGSVCMDVPFINQYTNANLPDASCGPTALAMAMQFFGSKVTPDQLIGPTGCTSNGTDAISQLAAAARQMGFPNAYSQEGGFDLKWIEDKILSGNPVVVGSSCMGGTTLLSSAGLQMVISSSTIRAGLLAATMY